MPPESKESAMARYLDGNVWKATPNTVAAMKRSAENRKCPRCNRKSAMVSFSDDFAFGSQCRWPDCGYYRSTDRETMVRTTGTSDA